MFYGEFEHALDAKSRLIIPAKFREVFSAEGIEKFFLTRGLDGCLFMFPEAEWRRQEQKYRSLSFAKPDARRFNRLFFSGAAEVMCDAQGRILIPQYLKQFAGIDEAVMLVGVSNRIEIWNKSRWQEFYDASRATFEETAANLMELE